MMNGNLFQFDEYQQIQGHHEQQQQQQHQATILDPNAVGDIRDYLTSDLKLSDVALNDLFSEFDFKPDDFQCFDPLTNPNIYSQTDLPPAYDTALLTNTKLQSTTNIQTISPSINDYMSSNDLQSLIEQHQHQQTIIKYSSSPPPQSIPTNYHDSSSISPQDASDYVSNRVSPGRKPSTNKRTRSSVPSVQAAHLPKLVKKPEPIPVTLDQFQALICSTPDTSNSNAGSFSSLLENSTIIGNNIPLRIINQMNNSDENTRHDSPTNNQISTTNLNGTTGGRIRRKSSHNAIEKRYRSSINERILELKEIVADTDEKVQKSGVLRRTVEYIRGLQSTNRRLEEENHTLKTILKRLNLPNVDIRTDNECSPPERTSMVKNPSTPPSSHSESSESTLGSSDDAYSPVPKRQKRTSKQGMVNGSRLILCCFMLCVLITNPFDYLLNRIHSSELHDPTEIQSIVSSRTLQSTSNNENINSSTFLSTSWRQLVAWMLNLAICLVCLIKLFVYGEPIIDDNDMQEYYLYKKKADQLMSENQLVDARICYRQCCEKLYVTIDNTFLYYLSSITWQMTRLCVNFIFVGRWLIFWSGWTQSIDTRDYNRELNDCLFQLWKIEYQQPISSLGLFNLFISTINTSTNAGKKIDNTKRNQIYLLSILTLKYLGGPFSLFIRTILKYLTISNLNDYWLNDIDRLYEFFLETNHFKIDHNNILSSIHRQYFQSILNENIQNYLLYQDPIQTNISIKSSSDLDFFSWWQHSLQVIRSISTNQQLIDHITSSDLLRSNEQQSNQTIYHFARIMNITDERFILIIETIHSILIVLHDDDQQTNQTRRSLLEQLGQTSRLITSFIENTINTNENNLDLAIKSLLLDGILSLRLRLLTSITIDTNETVPYLNDFQQELDSYKQLNQIMKLPKQRIYLFESIFRLASGLNPLATQTLFECALKSNHSNLDNKESPNLDILAALLLFCHFSPSTIYHYRNLLQQAANSSCSTDKNHDLNRLRQQCFMLIRQPYFTL